MARNKNTLTQTLTTAQRLGSLVKSARDIMRKDKGLNGDLDRLPMLTWILFLKFLGPVFADCFVIVEMKREKFRPIVESPYRWREWAAKEDGISGDALRSFINQEETVRPDGSKGAGLIAYLRGLQGSNGDDRRDVIRSVFGGVSNRMESGYLLRDVVNKVNGIHFDSTDEIHTLGHLYESMLKEMRDAAGDSGEFYTPRAVVRFKFAVTDPQLGEKILDPACGTGGFLVEAHAHLEKQCKTVQQRRILQEQSIFGGEAKSLPYMLCQMNLLLRKLRVTPKPGRAGVVVPNGTLFGDGVCARIKQDLLTKFNLHTIVRLPNGVFAPYTSIPTNLLFFDRSGPTEHVWYYEQPLPEGRKNYTKTAPIQFEEFADCQKWWSKRKENDRAWKVPVQKILDNNFNLDIKNPNAKDDFEHLPPEQLADDILQKELRIAEIMQEIKELLRRKP